MTKCKHCGKIGSDYPGSIIAGWISIELNGFGLSEKFMVCDGCSKNGYIVKINRPDYQSEDHAQTQKDREQSLIPEKL